MLFWLLASFLGTATLLGAIVSREGLLALGALFAPLLGSLLWWPQVGKGLVAGYGAAILGPPSFAVAVAYAAYWLGELVLGVFLRDSNGGAPVGRPDLDL